MLGIIPSIEEFEPPVVCLCLTQIEFLGYVATRPMLLERLCIPIRPRVSILELVIGRDEDHHHRQNYNHAEVEKSWRYVSDVLRQLIEDLKRPDEGVEEGENQHQYSERGKPSESFLGSKAYLTDQLYQVISRHVRLLCDNSSLSGTGWIVENAYVSLETLRASVRHSDGPWTKRWAAGPV